ncbi:hypothetical protein [Nocardioides sp. cx-173]|uniref:hypothetical protein n=1 Tax=Nocardioides sp. cx-173 TaxID=2898796 RepID=UPI001E476CF9|nr:hypothetical protein [Nocardioides sp. cx-173]MCD4525451.1 hypothetical protein [Nocardioides sp. cx-173]UGB40754.1 hypothetical protein LQ940_15405 [Nocardioides sp. cx-173]
MEILLWLVPPAVVTVLAMLWVSWLGREGRGEVDREVAVRRLGQALERPSRVPRYVSRTRERDRSTGIAVRPSRTSAPVRSLPPAEEPPQRRVS